MPETLEYLAFADAFTQPLCPACRVVRCTEERHIWSMLYERTLDPASRQAFDRARGFCRPHAGLAATIVQQRTMVNGARLAAWYESAVLTYLETARHPPGRCPTCVALQHTGVANTLRRMLEHPDQRDAYHRSDGLCLPHLEAVLARGDHPFLKQDNRGRMERLQVNLRTLLRKQAYDVLEEPAEDERDSWREAIWRFTGVRWDRLLVGP